MSGKKALLAGLLHRSGCLEVLRRSARGRLAVFNYHRIRPDGERTAGLFDDGVFGPTVSTFERQVDWLRRRTRLLSEEELAQAAASGRAPEGLSAMITFDDGYRDNFTLAVPVLQRLGVPALFFIPTQAIEERRLGWWDLIAYLLKRADRPTVSLDELQFDLRRRPRAVAIREAQRFMKTQPATATASWLDRLAEACEVPMPDAALQDGELMTWDQVRRLAQFGFGVGSHTHTHRVLATLEAEEQEEELRHSKAVLERQLGRRIRCLAYPVGGYAHFTRHTQDLAARCGYELGFSFNTSINRWEAFEPFDVKRIEGPHDLSLMAAATALPEVFA